MIFEHAIAVEKLRRWGRRKPFFPTQCVPSHRLQTPDGVFLNMPGAPCNLSLSLPPRGFCEISASQQPASRNNCDGNFILLLIIRSTAGHQLVLKPVARIQAYSGPDILALFWLLCPDLGTFCPDWGSVDSDLVFSGCLQLFTVD